MIHPYAYVGMSDPLRRNEKKHLSKHIIDSICDYFGVMFDEICVKTRKPIPVKVRYFIMLFLKSETKISLKEIGKSFGEISFDHTTVIHGIRTIHDLMSYDEEMVKDYTNIQALIRRVIIKHTT